MAPKKENQTITMEFEDNSSLKLLFGEHDKNLKILEELLGLNIVVRGNSLSFKGERIEAECARNVLNQLYQVAKSGFPIYENDIAHAVDTIRGSSKSNLKDIFYQTILMSSKNTPITPKSYAQKAYVDAINQHDIVFGIGPAGTGKTYLAMAMAVSFLSRGDFDRIILTRPAVEAGEKLGFLPGDMYEKVNPYLRPLLDALYDMMTVDRANKLVEKGVVEVAPLAFMRGRTLNSSFVILDEAQNTTHEQMKMFLTRLGLNSKAVITGDITQIDLPNGQTSGLIEVIDILAGIEGINFTYFSEKDVVRHSLVKEIIKAYEAKTPKQRSEG